MKTFRIIILAFFAIGIGFYPLIYFLVDMSEQGLLSQKSADLLSSSIWNVAFYMHISFGGLSLLTGWSQFSEKIRTRYIGFHRVMGFTYLLAVALSGIAGGYLALYANGGLISNFGFGFLALGWLFTTSIAYREISHGRINAHQEWMIRSYALTFAAVTLRVWLPLLQGVFHLDFVDAYRMVAWLCWVPNVIFAEFLIQRIHTARKSISLSR